MGIDSERFKVNSSKLILVRPDSGTSFGVSVCGTSNSETGVYNGTAEYITGCIYSHNLAGGSRVSLRALDKVGCVGIFGNSSNGMGDTEISVKTPILSNERVPALFSNSGIINRALRLNNRLNSGVIAYISVNGPRYVACISSMGALSLTGANPIFRGGRVFPSEIGARFVRVVDRARFSVHI